MSNAYKFHDQTKPYFITFTIVEWADLFSRRDYCEVVLDSIRFCQKGKGLIVYAWVIMTNHVHMIIGTSNKDMEDIMRDMKSFTSRKLREEIKNHSQESRKEWLLSMFENAGKKNGNNTDWQLWQQDNHPIELWDNYMIDNKLINPVAAGIVYRAEDYVYSSAIDYAGGKGLLEVVLLE